MKYSQQAWLRFAFGEYQTEPGGEEGGWSYDTGQDNPTYRGIEMREWCAFCHVGTMSRALFEGSATLSAIANYVIPEYWEPAHCDTAPLGADVLIADHCFNAGLGSACSVVRAWQRMLGVTADGVAGPLTGQAMHGVGDANALTTLRDCIEDDYKTKREWAVDGRGWIARLDRCLVLANKLAGASAAAGDTS